MLSENVSIYQKGTKCVKQALWRVIEAEAIQVRFMEKKQIIFPNYYNKCCF